MSLVHTGLKHADLVANCIEQAVAHLAHEAIGAALLALVPAGAEVNGRATAQFVGLVGDVAVVPAQLACQVPDAPQSLRIFSGHRIGQQFFDFVADGEGLVQ